MANLPDLKAKVKVEFGDLEAAALKAKLLGDALKKELGGSEVTKAANDTSSAIRGVTQSAESGTPALASLGSTVAAIGPVLAGSLIPALIAVGLALSPIIVLLSAMTVGVAAVLGVVALFGGVFAAASVGVIALTAATGQLGDVSGKGAATAAQLAQAHAAVAAAIKQNGANSYQAALAQAQLNTLMAQGQGPVAQLRAHFQGMADVLAKQALPLAQDLLGFLNDLIGPVQKLGSEVLHWLGEVLPDALNIAHDAVGPFLDILHQLGGVFADFVNDVFVRMPNFGPIVGDALRVGVQAVQGLLTNLVALGDWFVGRLPTLGPEVASIMSGLGNVIQGLGHAASDVVDFFIEHWPQIVTTARSVFNEIAAGIKFATPLIVELIRQFQQLAPAIQFIQAHADSLKPILIVLGAAIIGVIAVAIELARVVLLATAAIVAVAAAVSYAVTWLRDNLPGAISAAGGAFSALGSFVHSVADAFDRLINSARNAVGAIQGAIGAASQVPIIGGVLHAAGVPGFAEGGVALPGQQFLVGERGPELATALPGGGVVIQPLGDQTNMGPYNTTINVSGTGNPEAVAAAVDRRLSRLLTST